jgi:hypothetical protein
MARTRDMIRSQITLFADAADAQSVFVLTTEIPCALGKGDRIKVCKCCDGLVIDEDNEPPTWNVIEQQMEYCCWLEWNTWSFAQMKEHFEAHGFEECVMSREVGPSTANAKI